MKTVICIVCPKSCRITAETVNGELKLSGYACERGINYAKTELTNPTRVLTSTVKLASKRLERLPVKTGAAIPKCRLMEAMKALENIEAAAPVRCGDVVVKGLFGGDVDIVATRDVLE